MQRLRAAFGQSWGPVTCRTDGTRSARGTANPRGKVQGPWGTRPQGRSDHPLREVPPSNQVTQQPSRRSAELDATRALRRPGQGSEAEAHEKRQDPDFTRLLGTGRREPSPCPPAKSTHTAGRAELGGLRPSPEDAPQEMTAPTEMTRQCATSPGANHDSAERGPFKPFPWVSHCWTLKLSSVHTESCS